MTLALELLPAADSPLRRLDPRWKLAALGPAALACAVLRTPATAALAFAASLLLVALARLPWRWYLARLTAVALVLCFFVAWLPFVVRGTAPPWQLGPVPLAPEGIRAALVLTLKALAIVNLVLVLLTTAPLHATLEAAHLLHVPGLLLHLLLLTYRYAFVLAAELARVRVALRVRGYRNRATRHSYRTIGHIAGALLVRSTERAERVGQAMRCRGFTGEFHSLTHFQTTAGDLLFALVLLGGAAGLVGWDLMTR